MSKEARARSPKEAVQVDGLDLPPGPLPGHRQRIAGEIRSCRCSSTKAARSGVVDIMLIIGRGGYFPLPSHALPVVDDSLRDACAPSQTRAVRQ